MIGSFTVHVNYPTAGPDTIGYPRMERRNNYRVKIDDGILGLSVVTSKAQEPCRGRVIDMSVEGVGAVFPLSGCPALALESEVELSFTSDELKTPLVTSATVRSRADSENGRAYGFQFSDRDQFESRLLPRLQVLINRRSSFRVEACPESPVEVALETFDTGETHRGQLINISASGIRIQLPLKSDSMLAEKRFLRLSFSLPNCQRPFALVGDIRYRDLTSTVADYGIAFDLERSENFERQTDSIADYAAKRQREILSFLRQSISL